MSEKASAKRLTVLTGDRPTGKLHLGHFVGSIGNRLELQRSHDLLYMIADVQALTDNAANPEKVRNNVLEVALDNLACGIDPNASTLYIQSRVPAIAELTVFFLNLVTLSRLKQNPTVKTEMKQKGFSENVPAGFLMYPVSQAADILAMRAHLVPVGEDQLPVLEQTNEIVDSFNRLYGHTFDRIKPILSETPRLIGTDGKSKMSKSIGNTIYLSDEPKEVERKVMLMYTDPAHIHVDDPGSVKGNVVFQYLDVFDTKPDELADLKKQYRRGGLGDVVIKKRLAGILNELLEPIRERRMQLAKNPKAIMDMLHEGSKRASAVAGNTLAEVKQAMHIDYF